MTKNQELYGDHIPMDIPEEVIVDRLDALEKELEKQLSTRIMDRNGELCNRIVKAQRFWRNINNC